MYLSWVQRTEFTSCLYHLPAVRFWASHFLSPNFSLPLCKIQIIQLALLCKAPWDLQTNSTLRVKNCYLSCLKDLKKRRNSLMYLSLWISVCIQHSYSLAGFPCQENLRAHSKYSSHLTEPTSLWPATSSEPCHTARALARAILCLSASLCI